MGIMAPSAWDVAGSVIVALGGGGLIVFGLSAFLGKFWAERIMNRDRQKYAEQLETLRAELQATNTKELDELKSQLELSRQVQYHEYSEKVQIYRAVTDVIADILVDISLALRSGRIDPGVMEGFERKRLRLYGYLGIAAPQTVMAALDGVMDELLDMTDGTKPYDFISIRRLSYEMLNAIRVDVALDKRQISYTGRR
jgi:hypothetical protein